MVAASAYWPGGCCGCWRLRLLRWLRLLLGPACGTGVRRVDCSGLIRRGGAGGSTGGAGISRIAVRLTTCRGPSSTSSTYGVDGSDVDDDGVGEVVVPAATLRPRSSTAVQASVARPSAKVGTEASARTSRTQQRAADADGGAGAVVDHAQADHGLARGVAADADHHGEERASTSTITPAATATADQTSSSTSHATEARQPRPASSRAAGR